MIDFLFYFCLLTYKIYNKPIRHSQSVVGINLDTIRVLKSLLQSSICLALLYVRSRHIVHELTPCSLSVLSKAVERFFLIALIARLIILIAR